MSNFKSIKLLYETFIAGNDFTVPIRYQKKKKKLLGVWKKMYVNA